MYVRQFIDRGTSWPYYYTYSRSKIRYSDAAAADGFSLPSRRRRRRSVPRGDGPRRDDPNLRRSPITDLAASRRVSHRLRQCTTRITRPPSHHRPRETTSPALVPRLRRTTTRPPCVVKPALGRRNHVSLLCRTARSDMAAIAALLMAALLAAGAHGQPTVDAGATVTSPTDQRVADNFVNPTPTPTRPFNESADGLKNVRMPQRVFFFFPPPKQPLVIVVIISRYYRIVIREHCDSLVIFKSGRFLHDFS